jgi:hypothetical protein
MDKIKELHNSIIHFDNVNSKYIIKCGIFKCLTECPKCNQQKSNAYIIFLDDVNKYYTNMCYTCYSPRNLAIKQIKEIIEQNLDCSNINVLRSNGVLESNWKLLIYYTCVINDIIIVKACNDHVVKYLTLNELISNNQFGLT